MSTPISRTRSPREQTIADLRSVLRFLVAHPDVPIRPEGISYCILADDDEVGMAELHAIAAALGVEVTTDGGTHHRAHRMFGRVGYRAFYVTTKAMDDYDAGLKHLKECPMVPRAPEDVDGEIVERQPAIEAPACDCFAPLVPAVSE